MGLMDQPLIQKWIDSFPVICCMDNMELQWSYHGSTIPIHRDIAPCLCDVVDPRIQKARTVADGLQNDRWIRDISGALTVQVLLDYLLIWDLTRDVTLRPGITDRLLWKWTSDQTFSTASAYRSFFIGQYSIPGAKILAKTRAPGKCKFFGWQSMIGVGQLPGGSDTASKMMTTALCAARILKPSHTFSSAAPSPGKFGSGYYGLLPGTA